ncbi:MAG: VWA domain-containing protein [Isosphaeraceae bacterium]|nr:VWA domain-containing protein [Isosphaeraceae bacterium]
MPTSHRPSRLGLSPLTDPRSLGSSLLFHALVLAVASLAILRAGTVTRPELPRVLRGEIDTVDNRAPAQEAGGSPGELGGLGVIPSQPSANGPSPRGAARDPSADALLAEILPSPTAANRSDLALPGPRTSGLGVLPGPGEGGGGGSGGGSGGGLGRGIGPGTEFFGAREHAGSFAYVIDCSGSMATRGALDLAKRELTASLNRLPPDARFAVVFYNLRATTLADAKGREGLMPATTANKARVATQLTLISPDGGTDHMLALRTALAFHPEVVFFLTDAALMSNSDANVILAERGKSRIQAIEFGLGADLAGETSPLRRLATTSGGEYRYLDVLKFPRVAR